MANLHVALMPKYSFRFIFFLCILNTIEFDAVDDMNVQDLSRFIPCLNTFHNNVSAEI